MNFCGISSRRTRFITLLVLGVIGQSASLRGTSDGDGSDVFSAAKVGNVESLTDLIGSDQKLLNSEDTNGWTPLAIATKEGHAPA